jgi:hypothetical protein
MSKKVDEQISMYRNIIQTLSKKKREKSYLKLSSPVELFHFYE